MVARIADAPSINEGASLNDLSDVQKELQEAGKGNLPAVDRSLGDSSMQKLGFTSAASLLPPESSESKNSTHKVDNKSGEVQEKQSRVLDEKVDDQGKVRSRTTESGNFLLTETYDSAGNLLTFEKEARVCTEEYPNGYKLSQRFKNGELVYQHEDVGFEKNTFERFPDGTEITTKNSRDYSRVMEKSPDGAMTMVERDHLNGITIRTEIAPDGKSATMEMKGSSETITIEYHADGSTTTTQIDNNTGRGVKIETSKDGKEKIFNLDRH